MVIALCAVVSGADDFEEIAEYGREKESFLRQFLELPNVIPSHDTFNQVFRFMDKEGYEDCLKNVQKKSYQINIDGKVLLATGKQGKKITAWCIVSAWVSEHCLSLGQSKVSKKAMKKQLFQNYLELLSWKMP